MLLSGFGFIGDLVIGLLTYWGFVIGLMVIGLLAIGLMSCSRITGTSLQKQLTTCGVLNTCTLLSTLMTELGHIV